MQSDLVPSDNGDLWNLPYVPTNNRGNLYSGIIEEYAQGRMLDILEIGVYKAGLIHGVFSHCPEIVNSYTGLDPYLGDENDPYLNSYWKGEKSNADRQFDESRGVFEKYNGKLIRTMSDDYFRTSSDTFDVIIVDGDHRVAPALRDLLNSLRQLRPGGLLVCDDYGNSDTPEVTRAAARFVEQAGDFHDAAGFKPLWFQNAGKPAPIQLTVLYWRKKAA